jgi:hypothetical protein
MAGNLGGLVAAVVVGFLVDRPTIAFLLLAAVALIGLPLVRGRALGLTRPESGRDALEATDA